MARERTNVSEYAEMVPNEIQRALEGLSSDRRMAILVLLIKEDGLPFSKMENELGLHQQKLSTALGRLQDSGIVVREEVISEGRYRTEYRVTKFGKRILDGLFDAVEPTETGKELPLVIREFEDRQMPSNYYKNVSTSDKKEGSKTTFDQAQEFTAPKDGKTVMDAPS